MVVRGTPRDMLRESVAIADEYWAAEFGCARQHIRPRTPRLQQHAGGLSDYSGVFILVLDAAPLVSVPGALLSAVAPRADQFAAEAIRDPESLRRLLFPGSVTAVVGPALLNYADHSSFLPAPMEGARELTPQDAAAILALRAACLSEEWEAKGFSIDSQPTFGAFAPDGALMALANIRVWADRIAHLGVVTRPGGRNRGFGTRAVSAAVRHALGIGLLPQYRVLEHNVASRRVAQKLGFQSYGWTVAARLAPA